MRNNSQKKQIFGHILAYVTQIMWGVGCNLCINKSITNLFSAGRDLIYPYAVSIRSTVSGQSPYI